MAPRGLDVNNDFWQFPSWGSLRSKRFQSSYCAKVRAEAKLCSPPPPPSFCYFLLLSQLSRRTSRGNACYAGYSWGGSLLFLTFLCLIDKHLFRKIEDLSRVECSSKYDMRIQYYSTPTWSNFWTSLQKIHLLIFLQETSPLVQS